MVIQKKIIFLLMLIISSYMASSQNPSWKVVFFQQYVAGYDMDRPSDHSGFAKILNRSWQVAVASLPDNHDEKDLVVRVGEQVAFFVALSDNVVQQIETQKCLDGMKQAQGNFARWVPEGIKAHVFVSEFEKEWIRRNSQ